MKKGNIAFWVFVIGGYAVSRSLPSAYRDQVAFVMLFVAYVLFLMYKRLFLKKRFVRDDLLIGIPAVYGMIISALQYGNYIPVGSFVVWGIFVVLSIISLGYMGRKESSKR